MEQLKPKNDFYSGFLYAWAWDPIMKKTRKLISGQIPAGSTVIDIACGTGHQLINLATHIKHGVGIDISDRMVRYADTWQRKTGIDSVAFEMGDATDLSRFPDKSFDVSLVTLLLHEIHPEKRIAVLREMKRIARTVIVADYGQLNWPGKISVGFVEFSVGIFHAHHYVSFRRSGGLPPLLEKAGLVVKKELIAFGNTISIYFCTDVAS